MGAYEEAEARQERQAEMEEGYPRLLAENARLREQWGLAESHIRTLTELQGDDEAIIAGLREQLARAMRQTDIALSQRDKAGEGRADA